MKRGDPIEEAVRLFDEASPPLESGTRLDGGDGRPRHEARGPARWMRCPASGPASAPVSMLGTPDASLVS